MRLILTHEQADFDALASLYAASLLYEPAYPVLPHHLNRNVRAFLTLYGHEFGFLEARDLPPQAVEEVILVDTQSLITVRGMSQKTRVRVLDHHPRRSSLNPNWDLYIDEVGATTTLLVEGLQEHDGGLTPLQATLLLLGIYEDTGSLTYSRTTSRDAQAVAYLLEQGASLKMAAEFLNPPLSEAQRTLYDSLVANSETLEVQGHR
ncbi:MAG: DHH family phosphoesterase, partial [Candidatus Caldarchaeum sp.]